MSAPQSESNNVTGDQQNLAPTGIRITVVGIGVNALLIVLKLTAGTLGHSHALIADAFHSVSDFFTDAVVLFGLRMGRKPADATHHFGHGRIETLATTVVALSLIGVALFIGGQGVHGILDGIERQPTWLAAAAALFSLFAKELLYRATVVVGRRIQSPVIIANAWHHRSDALSSLAVFVGVVGARINPDWRLLDAVAAIIVALLVFRTALQLLLNSIKEITDTAPSPATVALIRKQAETVPGVLDVHALKARTVGGLHQVELHITVDGEITVIAGHAIADEVEARLGAEVDNVASVIVHVDPPAKV